MKPLTWKHLFANCQPCTPSEWCPCHFLAKWYYFFHFFCERKLTWNLFISERLPVIQALAAEVRQTTQSLLSQLLQKLRSNIQVLCSSQIKCKYSGLWDVEQNATSLLYAKDWILITQFFGCAIKLQLPECLRIIGYLRRIGVFSEYEMRLQVNSQISFCVQYWFGILGLC
jgi:hypothetical protein